MVYRLYIVKKHQVYILLNSLKTKKYVGCTNDLGNRLREHNAGESFYTKRFKPWEIIYTKTCSTKLEAIKLEKYFKSSAGRKWIKKNLFNN